MLTSVLFLFVAVGFIPAAHVNAANSTGIVLVQDSTYHNEYGWFSTHFVGLTLNSASVATIVFQAGDDADASWVVSYPDIEAQTDAFFENSFTFTFLSSGTWWFYLAGYASTPNFDYVQVRVVANSWTGPITPKFANPPFTWRSGYPPNGCCPDVLRSTSDDITGSDGAVATLQGPIMTSIPSRHSSTSTSTSVWLAPLLVGIIMIAITVPIVIFAYKKGKQNAKNNQVETEGAMENQQQQGAKQVEV